MYQVLNNSKPPLSKLLGHNTVLIFADISSWQITAFSHHGTNISKEGKESKVFLSSLLESPIPSQLKHPEWLPPCPLPYNLSSLCVASRISIKISFSCSKLILMDQERRTVPLPSSPAPFCDEGKYLLCSWEQQLYPFLRQHSRLEWQLDTSPHRTSDIILACPLPAKTGRINYLPHLLFSLFLLWPGHLRPW